MARIDPTLAGGPNVCAFLDMIAWSELGPEVIAQSDAGYNVLVGSYAGHVLTFDSYADHPNVYNTQLDSTAAGAYQELHLYWDHYRAMLQLPDFGPISQDRWAIQLIKECRALPLVINGRIDSAIALTNKIWASLAGSPYGQRVNTVEDLIAAYSKAGGTLA